MLIHGDMSIHLPNFNRWVKCGLLIWILKTGTTNKACTLSLQNQTNKDTLPWIFGPWKNWMGFESEGQLLAKW